MIVFSASGLTAVPVEMARGARRRGLRVIAVTSVAQSMSAEPEPAAGGAAARRGRPRASTSARRTPTRWSTIDGLETPVGPGSTIGAVAIVNSIKVRTAELLVERGAMPPVITRATSSAPSARGPCSTRPIESTRGGSPVRSTSEEVDDAPTGGVTRHDLADVCSIRRTGADRTSRLMEQPAHEERVECSTIAISRWPRLRSSASRAARRIVVGRLRRRRPDAADKFKIGYSNGGGVGNGFREEQVCTAKAEALASGKVAELTIDPPQHGRGRPAPGHPRPDRRRASTRSSSTRTTPTRSTRPSRRRKAAGIMTVSVDAYVTDPDTYNLYNNQVKYAYLGAKWLFEQLGGKGNVYYMRGLAGHPADTDRDIGFKKALAEYPDIKVVPTADGVHTGWDPATTHRADQRLHRQRPVRRHPGHLDVRHGLADRRRIKAANKPFVPIVGADLGGFVTQLLDPTDYPGLEGAAVTNTAAVGGAGVTLALKLLNGETVETDAGAASRTPSSSIPVVADNLTDAGKATLECWQSVQGLDPIWPLGLTIDGWTTYTPEQAVACKGPGEVALPHRDHAGDAGSAGIPRAYSTAQGPMTVTTTDLLLEATGVSKTYGAVVALKSASLAVRPGEVHALMGANGAGKSTLVKILTGAVRPDAGRSPSAAGSARSTRRPRRAAAASSPSTRSRRSSRTSTSAPTCA